MSGKLLWLALAATALFATGAKAETTVECQSINFQYDECHAAKLKNPQLIHQISSSACILNNTWGFNPKTRYIWVANGCSGFSLMPADTITGGVTALIRGPVATGIAAMTSVLL